MVKSRQGSFIRRDSSIDVGKTYGHRDSYRSGFRRATSVSNGGYLLESKDQILGKPQIPSGMAGLSLLGKKPKNQNGLRENNSGAIDETPHNVDLMSLTNANRLSKQIQNRMTTISKIGAVVNNRVSQMPQVSIGKRPSLAGTKTQNNSRDKFNFMREFGESGAEKLKITDDVNISNRSFDVEYSRRHDLDISTHVNTRGGSKSQFPSLDPIRPSQNPELNNNAYVDIFESKLIRPKAPTPNTTPNANSRLFTAHQPQAPSQPSRKSRTFLNESCDPYIGPTPKFEISRTLRAKHPPNTNSYRSNSRRGSIAQVTNNLGSNSRSGLNDEFLSGKKKNSNINILSGLVKPEKTRFGFAMGNNEGSGFNSGGEQPNVGDLANNRIVRKYERRLVRNGQWEVEEKDQKQISKLFDNFKQRTGASKAVSFPKSEGGLFGKIFGGDSNPEPETQVSTTNPEISDAFLDNTQPQNSTEIGDSISQMLFNSRLAAFKSKTEKFAAQAETINKQIKGIGATISKGAHGDDEKQLYEDIMKAHELKILLRSKMASSNQRAKTKKKAPRHSSKYRNKNPKTDPDDED